MCAVLGLLLSVLLVLVGYGVSNGVPSIKAVSPSGKEAGTLLAFCRPGLRERDCASLLALAGRIW